MNSRTKGADFERWVAAYLRARKRDDGTNLFEDVYRGVQSRGAESADVVIPRYWLELKRGRRPNIRRAMQQAITDKDRPDELKPVVISKADHDERLVTMKLDDWTDMLTAAVSWWEKDL